jgi:hypothetical protein
MSIHKITITANASWFIVRLENNASWVVPKDQRLIFRSKGGEASIGGITLNPKELMVESSSSSETNFDLEVYVETDETNLAVRVESGGHLATLTINSDVDQHTDELVGADEFSLRLT